MKFNILSLPKRLNRKSNFQRTIAKHWKSALFTCNSHIHQLFLDNGTPQLCFTKSINNVKFRGPNAHAVCIQKCFVDWKVENLELWRQHCRDPFVQWGNESSQVSIHSSPFRVGKEVDRESIWNLSLKSHHHLNGAYYFSVNLQLNQIIHKKHDMKVSFVVHLLNDDGRTVVTKELQNVLFKPLEQDKQLHSHGFMDFVSFSELNNSKNKIGTCFHVRLELFIPGNAKQVPLCVPKKYDDESCRIGTHISVGPSISSYEGCDTEVLARDRSFYVDSHKLEGHSKLKSLIQEDRSNGNLGIISLPDYSDRAVSALLTYIAGDYSEFVTELEEAVDILTIAYEFSLPVLAYDMWLSIIFLMRLENVPWITFLVHKYQAPEFVLNYVYIQLLSFMAELQNLQEFHFWAAMEPLAFSAMLVNADFNKVQETPDMENEKFRKEFYLRENLEPDSSPGEFEDSVQVIDEKYLEESGFEDCHRASWDSAE
ncbi:unnamed protein product [Allacma fusca]|uniref:Uncharacterized protein n=1 Tax=Allacma fusca TaxID=39272 RepID=A0A8J2LEN7_9HEXA|nr:unnamed protein product [Allacma fusca]